jgi:hypothetical protein
MRKFTKKQFYIFMFFAIASRIFEFFRAITKPPEVRFDFVILYIISTIAFIILTIALWKNTKKDDGSAENSMNNEDQNIASDEKRRSSFNYEERGQSSRKKI